MADSIAQHLLRFAMCFWVAAFTWAASLPVATAFGPAVAGTEAWKFATGGEVDSDPAVSRDGSTVYVGSGDENLYAVHAANGTEAWKFATGSYARGYVGSSPTLSRDGSTVYVGSYDKNLYAVHAADGTAARKP